MKNNIKKERKLKPTISVKINKSTYKAKDQINMVS